MNLPSVIFWLLAAAAIGSIAFCGIALYGALRFLQQRRSSTLETVLKAYTPPVSLLKPLYGLDRELEENLLSFFRQDYPSFEILFSVRDASDPAAAVAQRLGNEFPMVPTRLLVTGPPRYLNAKVHAMEAMMEAAAHDILVITDSDVRVAPDYLRSVVAPLSESDSGPSPGPKIGPETGPTIGMVTCISRGVPGRSLWSRFEALSMNTLFIPGVLSAWVLMGMEFALGPTLVVRKKTVEDLGGFGRLGDALADDFVLGELVANSHQKVVLAAAVPDHLVCNESASSSLRHRLRWERSSRRSRPAGYVGQVFMHTFPLGLLAWAAAPSGSALGPGLAAAALAARFLLAWIISRPVLRDREWRQNWWLLPLQDLLSFGVWCWAFFGREIEWRGARFRVLRGGKLERAA